MDTWKGPSCSSIIAIAYRTVCCICRCPRHCGVVLVFVGDPTNRWRQRSEKARKRPRKCMSSRMHVPDCSGDDPPRTVTRVRQVRKDPSMKIWHSRTAPCFASFRMLGEQGRASMSVACVWHALVRASMCRGIRGTYQVANTTTDRLENVLSTYAGASERARSARSLFICNWFFVLVFACSRSRRYDDG